MASDNRPFKLVDWEAIGEGIGYGLATVVLGPYVARARRTRRRMRSALRDWSEPLGATSLSAPPGARRCALVLPGPASLSAEITLDPFDKIATVTTDAPQIPGMVANPIGGAVVTVTRSRAVLGEPLVASLGGLGAYSDRLDETTCDALLDALAKGPCGQAMTTLDIHRDRIDMTFTAPTTAQDWQTAAAGIAAVYAWLVEKWPASYRT